MEVIGLFNGVKISDPSRFGPAGGGRADISAMKAEGGAAL